MVSPIQGADPRRRLDNAHTLGTRFRHTQVQGIVAPLRSHLVSGDHGGHIAGLNRNDNIVKIELLQQCGVVHGALHHGLRGRRAVFG